MIVLVFTAMQQLEKIKHLGENVEEISDRFALSFDLVQRFSVSGKDVLFRR